MFAVNGIIWHKSFGFGIITGLKELGGDTMLTISFATAGIKRIMGIASGCIRIPDSFVRYILDSEYNALFTKAAASSPALMLEDWSVSDNPLAIQAREAETFIVPSVIIRGKNVTCHCTCGEKSPCRHAASLLNQLHMIFSHLHEQIAPEQSSQDILARTRSLSGSGPVKKLDSRLLSIVQGIGDTYTEERFPDYLGALSNFQLEDTILQQLIRALLYNSETGEFMFSAFLDKKSSYYKKLNPFYQSAIKSMQAMNTQRSRNPDFFAYHFYDEDSRSLLSFLYNYDGKQDISDYIAILGGMIAGDPGLFQILQELSHGRILPVSRQELLFQHLSREQILTLFQDAESHFYYDLAYIEQLDDSQLAAGIQTNRIPECYYPQIIQKISESDNTDELAMQLYTNADSDSVRENILPLLSNVPGFQFYADFLENRRKNRYCYDTYLTGSEDAAKSINLTGIDQFFSTSISVGEKPYSKRYFIEYTLTALNGMKALRLVEEENFPMVTSTLNFLDRDGRSKIANAVYFHIKNSRSSEIQQKLGALMEQREREKEEQRRQEMIREMDSINSSIMQSVLLSGSAKADIDFYFYSESASWHSNLDFSMAIRIGIRKKYVVKDTLNFLNLFRQGATFRYGKEFEFTHLIDNVAEDKRAALRLLMLLASGYTEASSQKKYLPLNSLVLYDLISTLKGSTLFFNDVEYRVVLDELPFKVGLNNRYELTFSGQEEPRKYFFSSDAILVLDDLEHRIDLIHGNPEQMKLYRFVVEHKGQSVEPVLDSFREKIYSQFYPYMELDDEIKPKMAISELVINAFFDYTDKSITVRTKLERDGVATSADKLVAANDQIRYHTYLSFLHSLGFEDDILSDDARVLNFFSMDMTDLKKYCNVYLSDSIQNKKLFGFSKQSICIQYDCGIMDAFLEKSDYSDEELAAILRSIRRKKNYVLLSGDRIIDISGEDAKDFEKAVTDLGLNIDSLSEKSEITIQQALKGFAHQANCRMDDYLFRMVSDIRNFKNSPEPIPEVNAVLRPYQEEGFKWLTTLSNYHVGGILADDMGLGKTLEIITRLKADNSPQPNLVVCPKSLVFNWVNEFRKFDPDAEVVEIYGLPGIRKGIVSSIDPNKKITYITSYDSLRNDMEYYTVPFNNLILDEAQYIKNVKAQKSKSVKSLRAAHKFALTGTPIENNIVDLWSIFDFIMPGYFEDLSSFKSEYSHDAEFTRQVAKQIAPFVLRRTKGDVLKDLPEKYERLISVEMTEEQRKIYDAYKKAAKDIMEEGGKAFDLLPYLMRLRQICDDPALIVEDYKSGSGKLQALSAILDEYVANRHKILIFSQFVKELEQVELLLRQKGLDYYKITGSTPSKERISLMDSFNSSASPSIFLISLKAGGTGLNLTGADTVIHLDPWWNVAAENQASDRAHRIGQTKNVEVIKLICEKSVEERVIELQNLKSDLIDQLISNSDKSVTNISLEDIAFILK